MKQKETEGEIPVVWKMKNQNKRKERATRS